MDTDLRLKVRAEVIATPLGLDTITQIEGFANSPVIDSLAKFAVKYHNKKKNASLQFCKVVDARKQMVAGVIYYITVEANDGGKKKLYKAKVFHQSWTDSKEVMEFMLLGDASAGASTS